MGALRQREQRLFAARSIEIAAPAQQFLQGVGDGRHLGLVEARRAAAVEQERRIKENELSNQLALEGQRQALVDLEGQNQTRTAEFQARANEIWLGPWRGTDSRTLLALAFKAMGDNAQRIGTLTITPELLSGLMAAPREG